MSLEKITTKYTYDETKARVKFSQKIFRQIERSISVFLDYVPLDAKHLDVYSPKLISILLETGPEVLNSFELAVCETGFGIRKFQKGSMKELDDLMKRERELRNRKKSLTFHDYHDFLLKHSFQSLNTASIEVKETGLYTMPFAQPQLSWWENYNQLRHDKYNNLKNATLRNAIEAVSALFWLIDANGKTFHFDEFQSRIFRRIDDQRFLSLMDKI